MGATAIYTLPWPELDDAADGPASFQNLAQATEAALKTVACTLVTTYMKEYTGNNDLVANTPREFNMGPVTLPSAAQTVLINWSVCLDASQPGVFGQWAKWDGVELYHPVYNTYSDDNTHDRTYSFSAAVADQVAGSHAAVIGLNTSGSCNVWIKSLSYNVVALGG